MKFYKKIISLAIIYILLLLNVQYIINAKTPITTEKSFKAAVFIRSLDNYLLTDIKKSLEDIEKDQYNKIDFSFFDSKWDQGIQNEYIEKSINENYDIFVIIPVSTKIDEIKNAINKVVASNIPFILYLPTSSSLIKTVQATPRSAIVTRDVEQSGTLQGKILAKLWNTNKDTMDKSKDNVLDYVLLQGSPNYLSTIARTKYSLQALTEENIHTKQLLSVTCNWEQECAKRAIESAFLTLSNKIEAIISNNDDMAIGAIEALQKYGYNKSDKSKFIPVVGIGGSSKAKELINQGVMAGTVIEDIPTQIKALYDIGMNLISGKNITYGTNLKTNLGNVITIPYQEYIYNPRC
ncbi:galactose ABC transporter substrate-binding protein [Clostridium cellulovorans]|uniref:D-galactose/methyl-galactoside binding periplasmic protein MglB n=1 Tax=Clostridium cellulovorans (strain ATCC 35296 / DSM 3052 / OCM 3 / 743B) TaxID=573061 RepID=D9SR91_CLOC7|nr:galactose ABC transporter substrate-binding protein [Clostridium cellulovorans]ADL52320.1 periplasmic binding protein/LacI transcriptional regulator [Clostridium cellulovorans 743B]